MMAMLLYAAILGGLSILFLGAISALRDAFRQRARLRGFLAAIAVALLSLAGMFAMLI
ncbi:MAG: hypothetical protein KF785_01170 [Gemmatimonadales bacterium]|nr:hypothetical protein [Gemmatimonadales bacterium]HMP08377.1 hypothetical protein [Lacipirellulaceae bacterium]